MSPALIANALSLHQVLLPEEVRVERRSVVSGVLGSLDSSQPLSPQWSSTVL